MPQCHCCPPHLQIGRPGHVTARVCHRPEKRVVLASFANTSDSRGRPVKGGLAEPRLHPLTLGRGAGSLGAQEGARGASGAGSIPPSTQHPRSAQR